jgi:hypothetical protein
LILLKKKEIDSECFEKSIKLFDLICIRFDSISARTFDLTMKKQFGFNLIFDSAAIEPSTKAIWTESSFLFSIFF